MSEHQEMRSALVTGSSSGIGRATVDALAAAGWRVFAGVRDAADREHLTGVSDLVTALALDVTSASSIRAAVAEVRDVTGGRLDAVVNNAGIPGAGPVETVPIEQVRKVLETNLIGVFAVTQACLPLVRVARGRIVIVSSLGGQVAFPYASPYHASKFGVEGLAESLRAEVRPLGVSVSLVEPAAMATDIWRKGQEALADSQAAMTDEQRAVYGEQLDAFAERLKGAEDSADPVAAADTIVRALTEDSPSDRYHVGRGAATLAWLRPLLPDAVFDRLTHHVAGGL